MAKRNIFSFGETSKIQKRIFHLTEDVDGRLGYRFTKKDAATPIVIKSNGDYIVQLSFTCNGIPFDIDVFGNCKNNECGYQLFRGYQRTDPIEERKTATDVAKLIRKAMKTYKAQTPVKQLAYTLYA